MLCLDIDAVFIWRIATMKPAMEGLLFDFSYSEALMRLTCEAEWGGDVLSSYLAFTRMDQRLAIGWILLF